MPISSITSSGLSGLQAATAQLNRAAAETAEAASLPTDRISLPGEADLISATTSRITAEASFRANLKTLQTAESMNDTLLELLTRR